MANIIHGEDVYKTQKELGQAAKNVYEKGKSPGFLYPETSYGVKLPKRLQGPEIQLSKTDKLLYRAGKYGPTALVVKAPIAGAAGVAIHNSKRPKRPSHLPDDLDS
tara:strand:+ start:498 stop:815 length:318 start_codon:yes stop_codon:yes gene_type:complete